MPDLHALETLKKLTQSQKLVAGEPPTDILKIQFWIEAYFKKILPWCSFR